MPIFKFSTTTTSEYGGIFKRWNGSQWVRTKLKVYVGGSWQSKPLKVYKNGEWKLVDTNG
jgi:hypothetical protein